MPRSGETRHRVEALFRDPRRQEATQPRISQWGTNLPLLEKLDEHQFERVWCAALRLSHGEFTALRKAADLAEADWRDLLMAAGFGLDARAHEACLPDAHAA